MKRAMMWLFAASMSVLGGCLGFGASGTDAAAPAPVAAGDPVWFDDSTGAIEGVVMDDSLMPLGGASVAIQGTSIAVETEADGRFGFSYLPPGVAVVMVQKAGFGNASQAVDVQVGHVSRVVFTLENAASDRPYTLVEINSGLIGCSFSVVMYFDNCHGIVGSPDSNVFDTNVSAGHHGVIAEATWQRPNRYMNVWFQGLNQTEDDRFAEGQYNAATPLRVEFLNGSRWSVPGTTMGRVPNTTDSWRLRGFFFDAGDYQKEINSTLGPVCRAAWRTLGGPDYEYDCWGVGVATDFRFSYYVSVFMNGLPAEFGRYSAVPDQ